MKATGTWSRIKAVVCIALLVSGLLHLVLVPSEFIHNLPHGFLLMCLGGFQIGFGLYFFSQSISTLKIWLAMALTGGIFALWLLNFVGMTAFAHVDLVPGYVLWMVRVLELIGFAGVLVLHGRLIKVKLDTSMLVLALFTASFVLLGFGTSNLMQKMKWVDEVAMADHLHNHTHNGESLSYNTHNWTEVWDKTRFLFSVGNEFYYDWKLPKGFPEPRVPANNPITKAKVELGRHLFYDIRLSGNNTISCASCHHQDKAFTDGVKQPLGSTGMVHPKNSLSIVNSAYNTLYTWANPSLDRIEQQVLIPMFGEFPVELGITGNETEVLDRFNKDSLYQRLFSEAFPKEEKSISYNSIAKAVASFSRAIISGNSRYDQFVYDGDVSALTQSEINGMNLFFSERLECHHCHGGFNFTLSTAHKESAFLEKPFHNTGLYNTDGKGSYPDDGKGLIEFTGKDEDMGKFKAPSLRNVEVTAPYMHDGSIATLEEVIRFYERGGRNIEKGTFKGDGKRNPYKSGFVKGFVLTDAERKDLIAFLNALTDETLLVDSRFSDPFGN